MREVKWKVECGKWEVGIPRYYRPWGNNLVGKGGRGGYLVFPPAFFHLRGHGAVGPGHQPSDEPLGTHALAAVTGYQYAPARQQGFQLLFSVHAACSI